VQTGCDIQLVQTRANTKKIAEEFFSVSEREYIFSQDGNQYNETRFFEIWTLKECFLKLRGLSVFDMAKVPSFSGKIKRTFFFYT
jgi:4'-phosphopantetheinyl transferase